MDPTVAALDIETYGALKGYPTQQEFKGNGRFCPQRSLYLDLLPNNLSLKDLILTVSLTLPASVPHQSPTAAPLEWLASMRPGDTIVYDMRRPTHRRWLTMSLSHLTHIIGLNLPFDIGYLRYFSSSFRAALSPSRITLIDISTLNHFDDDTRPERSLKDLTRILLRSTYDFTAASQFSSFSTLSTYNAEDTHNSLGVASYLAHRIHRSTPGRWTHTTTTLYSDALWSSILMTEAGVPFHRPTLEHSFSTLSNKLTRIEELARTSYSLTLSGTGSVSSKQDFFERCIQEIDSCDSHLAPTPQLPAPTSLPPALPASPTPPSTLSPDNPSGSSPQQPAPSAAPPSPSSSPQPLPPPSAPASIRNQLTLTPIAKQISLGDENRLLLSDHLSPTSRLRRPMRLFDLHTHAQKLLSTYLFPLLYHSRRNPLNKSSVLVPCPSATRPSIQTSHPTWFVVPSPAKDTSDTSGGTQQSRITCKKGAHQTDPPSIQAAYCSRWATGYLVKVDLSQIELRVAGLLSGEPSIVDEYLLELTGQKSDLHTARAIQIFGPSITSHPHWNSGDSANDPRQIGKTVNFADLFRSSGYTMYLSVQQMSKNRSTRPLSFFENIAQRRSIDRPVLWAYQESLLATARSQKSITLPLTGQRRTFLNPQNDRSAKYEGNEIINYPIQATAANLTLRLQAYFNQHLPSSILQCLNIYDAIIFDCQSLHLANLLISEILPAAISWVSTSDYWAHLSSHYSRTVPLRYDAKILPTPKLALSPTPNP